jgi:hypothetical protein
MMYETNFHVFKVRRSGNQETLHPAKFDYHLNGVLAMITKSELKMWENRKFSNIKSGIYCMFCPSWLPNVFRSTSQHLFE